MLVLISALPLIPSQFAGSRDDDSYFGPLLRHHQQPAGHSELPGSHLLRLHLPRFQRSVPSNLLIIIDHFYLLLYHDMHLPRFLQSVVSDNYRFCGFFSATCIVVSIEHAQIVFQDTVSLRFLCACFKSK